MKVYSLSLLSVTPANPAQATLLGTSQDLSSFSFYQRGSVGEFMQFFTKVRVVSSLSLWVVSKHTQTVAERTPANQPSSVEENNYKAHVFRAAGRGANAMGMAGKLRLRHSRPHLIFSGDDYGSRIPLQARILAPHQVARRAYCSTRTIAGAIGGTVIRLRFRQRFWRQPISGGGRWLATSSERKARRHTRKLFDQVPGPKTGRHHHEGATGAG